MSYKLLADRGVQRVEDGTFIPNDDGNIDWQKYQAWLKAGGTPLPADPIFVPAKSLSDGDLAALLVQKQILAQADVDAAIASVEKP